MQASPEFHKFGRRFIQDIDWIAPTEEEMYDFVLSDPIGEERARLREFIDRALQDDVPDDELMRLWDSVDSDIYFPTVQNLRGLLRGARPALTCGSMERRVTEGWSRGVSAPRRDF